MVCPARARGLTYEGRVGFANRDMLPGPGWTVPGREGPYKAKRGGRAFRFVHEAACDSVPQQFRSSANRWNQVTVGPVWVSVKVTIRLDSIGPCSAFSG